jgi:hypothetical protein
MKHVIGITASAIGNGTSQKSSRIMIDGCC